MKELVWLVRDSRGADMLGFLPMFILEDDPRPVKEQINDRYAHGGGWNSFKGFEFSLDDKHCRLIYPASSDGPEEVYRPLAFSKLRDEAIILFEHAWLMVIDEKTKTWDVARID